MHISARAAFPLAALFATQFAPADDLFFSPACDNTWQGCCQADATHMQNNWGRFSIAPVCPALPSLNDTVTITTDCVIAPPPGSVAQIINQSNAPFTVNGPLGVGQQATFDGPVIWNAGEIARGGGAAGQFATANGGLTIQGDADKTLSFFGGFQLTNTGVGTWSGAGNWTIGMIPGGTLPSIFRNETGATFTVLNDSRIFSTSFGVGRFENAGLLVKDQSTGTSTWDVNLSNSGIVQVKTGVLRLTRGGTIGGSWTIDPGAELQIAGNFFELDPAVELAGRAVVLDCGVNPGIVVNNATTIDDLTIAPTGITGGTAVLSFRGTLTVEGGIPATPIVILPDADLQSQGSQRFGPLTIQGTAHLNSGATGSFGGLLTVSPGGEVIIADGATLGNSSLGVQPIQNNGVIRKEATGGTTTILSAFNQFLYNNAGGLIDVPAGVMECGCKLETSSEIRTGAGATFHQATWASYHAGASFTGAGTLYLTAQNNFVDTGVELPVTNLVIESTIGGGGGIFGPGTVRVSQSLELRGGYCDAATTIEAGATLNVAGPNFTQTQAWENHGAATIVAGGMNYFGTFTNHAGAVVDIQSDVNFGGRFGNGVFNNQGLFKKTGGSGGDSTMLGTLNNAGGVEMRSGRLAVNTFNQSAGTTLLAGGGVYATLMSLSGGTLTGNGTIASALVNTGGGVAPGAPIGALQVTAGWNSSGDYTQGAAGSLRIDIGGLAAGTQFDQLIVARNASLNGGLNLALVGGYEPNVGDSFTILTTGGTRSGVFSHVSGVEIGGGKRFSVQYASNGVTVTVTNDGTTPGDLDGDGHVSLQDLAMLLGSFGTCDGDAAFAAAADINGDGCVSIGDLAILLGSFGQ